MFNTVTKLCGHENFDLWLDSVELALDLTATHSLIMDPPVASAMTPEWVIFDWQLAAVLLMSCEDVI